MDRPTALIIGAGPAGLTAAAELLARTDIHPIVVEMSGDIGGISKTVNFKGNRIDLGGHRFFSKSDRVMAWWREVFAVQGAPSWDDRVLGRRMPLSRLPQAPDPDRTDEVLLIRRRFSRIYHLGKFFAYPVSLSLDTIMNLGMRRMISVGLSYAWRQLRPIRPETSLEDFFINRFGRSLYETFFEHYTEKVWGIPCDRIKPEWGAQRVKELSIRRAVWHALKKTVSPDRSIAQKDTDTSLIEQFYYPKYGPGQLWSAVADRVRRNGGEIRMNCRVAGLEFDGKRLYSAEVQEADGSRQKVSADWFFSSMPVKDLMAAFGQRAPEPAAGIAADLSYRDFITVGLLLRRLKVTNRTSYPTINNIVPDNWIYVQERDVRLGRIQIFNNWSPYMVRDRDTVWVGLEYFANEGDALWSLSDRDLITLAGRELAVIGLADKADMLDGTVIRMPKAYPGYFGSYDRFQTVRDFLDNIDNLWLIGRNGMHRYNNMDHSMLTAMTAVDNIINGVTSKENLWQVNAETDYHEEKRREIHSSDGTIE
ncbi:MAG: NAD(P)/FAD-dependent oxidoreductase [Deltaproteobacteria bacterium]|nr:NAD(P)/FAD-dependent oxidoreductase [Deltaproteobacteria bacterium]